MAAGVPLAVLLACPELIVPDVVTITDVGAPLTSGTDADWFSTKMPERPELIAVPGKVVTLALPSLEIAMMPLEIVLLTAPVTVAPAPTRMLIGPVPVA